MATKLKDKVKEGKLILARRAKRIYIKQHEVSRSQPKHALPQNSNKQCPQTERSLLHSTPAKRETKRPRRVSDTRNSNSQGWQPTVGCDDNDTTTRRRKTRLPVCSLSSQRRRRRRRKKEGGNIGKALVLPFGNWYAYGMHTALGSLFDSRPLETR